MDKPRTICKITELYDSRTYEECTKFGCPNCRPYIEKLKEEIKDLEAWKAKAENDHCGCL